VNVDHVFNLVLEFVRIVTVVIVVVTLVGGVTERARCDLGQGACGTLRDTVRLNYGS
jgi:hypothetical protein